MTESLTTITIHQCPKCEESHQYDVRVESTQYRYTKELKKSMAGPVKLFFGRNFTCPIKKKLFYARFWVQEDTGHTIESVTVVDTNR